VKRLRVTLRQLEYLVATVEHGTFSAAAQHLHISQTAVSLAVADLERALDVQVLIRRKAKGPALTPAGRELLADARRVLVHAGELEDSARGVGQQVAGRLVVGCFPTITPYVMARILDGFPRRYPRVEVDLLESSVDGLQDALVDGRCEAAIMYDIGIRPGVVSRSLYRIPPHAVLPATHPLAGRDSVALHEIAAEPMVMIDMPPSVDFFTALLTRAGHPPNIRHRTAGVESVRSLVARGLGWSMLLHRPAVDLSYEGLEVAHVAVGDLDALVDVLLVMPAGVRPTRRVRALADYCLHTLAGGPDHWNRSSPST
jgi:DNA-binding transcriptional LysR family regulator